MLIGFGVDSDILLNNHVLRRSGGFCTSVYRAMETGITMTLTSIAAMAVMAVVATIFNIDLMADIGVVLVIGLTADLEHLPVEPLTPSLVQITGGGAMSAIRDNWRIILLVLLLAASAVVLFVPGATAGGGITRRRRRPMPTSPRPTAGGRTSVTASSSTEAPASGRPSSEHDGGREPHELQRVRPSRSDARPALPESTAWTSR